MASRCSARVGVVAALGLVAALCALSSSASQYIMPAIGKSVQIRRFAGAIHQQRHAQVKLRAEPEEDEMTILGPLHNDKDCPFFEEPPKKQSSANVQGGGVFAVLMSGLALGVCVTMTAPKAVQAMTNEALLVRSGETVVQSQHGPASAKKVPLAKLGTVAGHNLYFGSPSRQ